MLSAEQLRTLFEELGARLAARGVRGEIVIVGGAAMVLRYGARASTRDVDAVRIAPAAVRDEIAALSTAHGLPLDWLNDRARAFAMSESTGPVLVDMPGLRVSTVAPEQLLAMKLSALRDDVDYDDARLALGELTGEREDIWQRVAPFLVPGFEDWKRQNFDALWDEVHGTR